MFKVDMGGRGCVPGKHCQVKAGGGQSILFMVIAASACCVTNCVQAIGMADRVCVAMAGVASLFSSIIHASFDCVINGTPSGVLLRVWH
jgi:hypothetical protein